MQAPRTLLIQKNDTDDAEGAVYVYAIGINSGPLGSGNTVQQNLICGTYAGDPISMSREENLV